jgi:cellulose synthase/poly-beta-1,6-N-acetylglucosamine synthase-like glycosyltransferase
LRGLAQKPISSFSESIEEPVKPPVSILIPAYNAEEFIADAIRSAIAQTWRRPVVGFRAAKQNEKLRFL